MKYFSISFLWAFFQWFFSGKDGYCGFAHFPTFGMEAWKHTYVLVFPRSLYISNYLLHFSQIKCYWSFLFGYRAFADFSLILAQLWLELE